MSEAISQTDNVSVETHLDVIEQMVEHNEWTYDRRSATEMAVQVTGSWCDYSLYFAWSEEMYALHFTCAFDMRVADNQQEKVSMLLELINDRLWLGCFCIWKEEGSPMFRNGIPFHGTYGPTVEQMEILVETAIGECERFYPAFQYVIWGGYGAEEAIELSMIDTVGEA